MGGWEAGMREGGTAGKLGRCKAGKAVRWKVGKVGCREDEVPEGWKLWLVAAMDFEIKRLARPEGGGCIPV